MAEIPYVISNPQPFVSPSGKISYRYTITWETIGLADTCQEVEVPPDSLLVIQIGGTWGGASLAVKGRVSGTPGAVALYDLKGGLASLSDDGLLQIFESVPYIILELTGGDGTTDLDAIMAVIE